jgi:hypothetical protein
VPSVLADVVGPNQTGMIQERQGFNFIVEPAQLVVTGQESGQVRWSSPSFTRGRLDRERP